MSPSLDRRTFLQGVAGGVAAASLTSCSAEGEGRAARPNVLLVTADDLGRESVGVHGCPIAELTPEIDRLAAEGLRFEEAHVTVSSCLPSRSVLMTGRYPHQNGAVGFEPVRAGVPTLVELLREAGFRTGILGKVDHLRPAAKFPWQLRVGQDALQRGRDPRRYGERAGTFFRAAREAGQPFFLMANALDPHRPFPGSEAERRAATADPDRPAFPEPTRVVQPDEVSVPAFLPDLPRVRADLAGYYTAVHRSDQVLGEVLRALEEAGAADETLVVFLSDNGMPFPFGKAACFRFSTRVPWIVRWPGRIEPGSVDRAHHVSGVDLFPTLLELLGLPVPDDVAGRSLVPLLEGREQAGRDAVYTVFDRTSGGRDFPTRAVHRGRFGYLYNAWSDGRERFANEASATPTFEAMRSVAASRPAIAERLEHWRFRAPEELYDYEEDPGALRNLAGEAQHAERLTELRRLLFEHLRTSGDPVFGAFRRFVGR